MCSINTTTASWTARVEDRISQQDTSTGKMDDRRQHCLINAKTDVGRLRCWKLHDAPACRPPLRDSRAKSSAFSFRCRTGSEQANHGRQGAPFLPLPLVRSTGDRWVLYLQVCREYYSVQQ